MGKMPLEWHKNCLHNMESSLVDQRKRLESYKRDVERTEQQIEFLKVQIIEAQRLGEDAFDPEKFQSKLRKNYIKSPVT
jgi:hypothetical protein